MNVPALRERLLHFNIALQNARVAFGSTDELHDMEEWAYPHVQWYNKQGRQSLKHFIMNLDAEQNVKVDSGSNKLIYDGICTIMDSIVTQIATTKPQLAGKLVKTGSAYNHMKINQPDEFDFSFELDIHKLLNKKLRFRTISSDISMPNRIMIQVDFQGDHPDVAEFDIIGYPNDPQLDEILSLDDHNERYKSMISKHGDTYLLNTEAIAFAMFNVLDSVVSNLKLPANWSHGGYNSPNYSGLRLNIPAYLMQFAYYNPCTETTLIISVDFAPVLKLSNTFRAQSGDLLDEFLDKNGYIECLWQRLDSSTVKGGHYSLAEEKWLSTYAPDSVPKVVVRSCKALHSMVKLNKPKYLSRFKAEEIAAFLRLKKADQKQAEQKINNVMMMAEHNTLELEHFKSETDFATFYDINEAVGENGYVSSYIFKRIVMTLMALDGSQGRKWDIDEVPDLVLSVFMIINDVIISINQATLVVSSITKTTETEGCSRGVIIYQPRSTIKNIRQPPKTTSILKVELRHLQNEGEEKDIYVRSGRETDLKFYLKWYFCLHKSVKDGKCKSIANLFGRKHFCEFGRENGLDDRIARVLDLLQYVAKGESKAWIRIQKYPIGDENKVEKNGVMRKDLDSLMLRETS